MLKCQQCGSEFEAKRVDARFCSAKCRQNAKRGVTANRVTDNQGTLVTDNVTDKDCRLCNKKYVVDADFEESCLFDEEGGFRALAENRRCAHRAKWILNHHTLAELEDYNKTVTNKIFIPNWKRKEEHGDFKKDE